MERCSWTRAPARPPKTFRPQNPSLPATPATPTPTTASLLTLAPAHSIAIPARWGPLRRCEGSLSVPVRLARLVTCRERALPRAQLSRRPRTARHMTGAGDCGVSASAGAGAAVGR